MLARIPAAFVVASALLVAPAHAQHPAWALAIGRSICALRQSGMTGRQAVVTALRQQLPLWRDEILEEGTRQAGPKIAAVVIEECPSEAAAMLEEMQGQREATPLDTPPSQPQARPGRSQACSSYILVDGRKQCM